MSEHVFTSDGFTYTVQALKVKPSRQVQLALARALGPLFSAENEGEAMAELLKGLQESDLDFITNTFGAVCTFEEDGANYRMKEALDKHFAGRPVAYWRWLAGCVSGEFADFFQELKKLLNAVAHLKGQTQSGSKSPAQ